MKKEEKAGIFIKMKCNNLLRKLKNEYINRRGFHTDRKIIVIESDDWGSIRVPSKAIYEDLEKLGDPCASDAFLRYDSLERKEDIEQLVDVLCKYKDKNGRHPCVTANFAVANPNFEKIIPGQQVYSYEPFTTTYEKYFGSNNGIMNIIKEAMNNHLFLPQLHCREHMNVSRWMTNLCAGNADTMLAFAKNMIGVGASFSKENHFGYMDALNYDSEKELDELRKIIIDASKIFEKEFGYKSKTFVASCFVWTSAIEEILAKIGIEMIQTQFKQNICPFKGTSLMFHKFHYSGQMNKYGQVYSVRNCEYEPAYDHQYQRRASACIKQIKEAFAYGKPAVINSHRLNYISAIDSKNGTIGLYGLEYILKTITETEPEIEFLSSEELSSIIH